MDSLLSFLMYAGLFFLIMRFGCGSHKAHGKDESNHSSEDRSRGVSNEKHIDPVCGMEVDVDKGYGVMYQGQLYRFCHRSCLDKFEADPKVYLEADDTTARIQGDGL